MGDIEDKDILLLFFQNKKRNEAFKILVDKYSKQLYWHIRKIVLIHEDCDDVLQNTFVKIWKNLANFRKDSQLYTWMYRIATNEALSFIEIKKKKWNLNTNEEFVDLMITNLKSDLYFDGDEAELRLQAALLKLPEKQRAVFNMKYYDDMKYSEISEILETSVGALKASYHHAVKKIEGLIEQ
ncbi:MAG: sigma-70 family RNA polymerase sigma factor [Marinifilaceae bacterium]|jgi:RNA polymerase sigma-70 factor (ECF subfamily)|nr:sigma-70 family RNA polymerase sigma factor [Marinifilaceae bacterium]